MNAHPGIRLVLALAAALPPLAARAIDPHLGAGVPDAEYIGFDGTPHALYSPSASANVMVFFEPRQARSREALRAMARCAKDLANKRVRWVAVASDSSEPSEVRDLVAKTSLRMPVVVDAGDALAEALEIRSQPFVLVLDSSGRLLAREPFREVGYADLVRTRIRWALHEISDAELSASSEPPAAATARTSAGIAQSRLAYARFLLRMRYPAQAMVQLEKSIAAAPNADAYALQGRIRADEGRCEAAFSAFEAALALEPAHSAAREGKERCRKVTMSTRRAP